MKKIIILLIIILLTGCDYTEIEDTLLIDNMIIDYNKDNYEINVETINDKNKTYKLTCQSIEECIYKLSNISNKDILISHLKSIILTKRTINNNIEYIDYFLRNTKSKMNFNVFYIDDKYKEDLLKIKNKNSLNSTKHLSFLDLIYKQKEKGLDTIYPNITIKDDNIYLNTLISFKDNKELILNEHQSLFYNIISNNIKDFILNIPCDNKYFSLTINNSKTKFKLDDNILNINTNIKGKIINYNCKYKLDNKDTINKLSNLTEDYIDKNINDLINTSISNNIDFIGLNNYVYKYDYKNHKKYNLQNLDIKNKSKSIILSIGEMDK